MSEEDRLLEFLKRLSSLLEVDVTELSEKEFSEIPSYDSLAKIQLAALVEDLLGHFISQDELAECASARSVYDFAISSED